MALWRSWKFSCTWYLVPCTWYLVVGQGTWYLVLGSGTWYLVPGNPPTGIRYQVQLPCNASNYVTLPGFQLLKHIQFHKLLQLLRLQFLQLLNSFLAWWGWGGVGRGEVVWDGVGCMGCGVRYRYQVPGYQVQVPGTRYQVPSTRYQLPLPGTRHQVKLPSSNYHYPNNCIPPHPTQPFHNTFQ